MNSQNNLSPIEKTVMSKINSGQIKMHKRSYYVSLGLLAAGMIALLVFATTYFASIASLWLRIDSAPGQAYGAKANLADMVQQFPWWSVMLGALTLVAIVIIIRKFGKLYKIRLLYFVTAMLIFFAVLGIALSYSPLPDMFGGQGARMMNGNNSQSGGRMHRQ